jgi:hypothetical protein
MSCTGRTAILAPAEWRDGSKALPPRRTQPPAASASPLPAVNAQPRRRAPQAERGARPARPAVPA